MSHTTTHLRTCPLCEARCGLKAEIRDKRTPGVVCLPHGWGRSLGGVRMNVAAQYPGVNNNLLAPADLFDLPSGNTVVNGNPVEISQ